MADSTTKNAMGEFAIFIKLPPELRLHTWCHALPSEDEFPNKDTHTLYTYRSGYWYLKIQHDKPLNLDWRLLKARAHMPLLFVNYEARSVALAWLRDHDMQLHECINQHYKAAAIRSLIPKYDLRHDVIYLGKSVLDDFCKEPYDLLEKLDLKNQEDLFHARKWKEFSRLSNMRFGNFAVSEDLLIKNARSLAKLFRMFSWPSVLYVIVNAPAAQETDPVQESCLWRLEVLDYPQRRFLKWNPRHGGFEAWEPEYNVDEDQYRQLEIASRHLMNGLCNRGSRSFRIQPALAIRK